MKNFKQWQPLLHFIGDGFSSVEILFKMENVLLKMMPAFANIATVKAVIQEGCPIHGQNYSWWGWYNGGGGGGGVQTILKKHFSA